MEDGTIIDSAEYLPYGLDREPNALLQTSTYKFTDQEQDDGTGLYNYDARLYDPVLGQFIMADTIVPELFNPQSLNRYAYCLNNPVRYVDPTGHEPDEGDVGYEDYNNSEGSWGASSGGGWDGNQGAMSNNNDSHDRSGNDNGAAPGGPNPHFPNGGKLPDLKELIPEEIQQRSKIIKVIYFNAVLTLGPKARPIKGKYSRFGILKNKQNIKRSTQKTSLAVKIDSKSAIDKTNSPGKIKAFVDGLGWGSRDAGSGMPGENKFMTVGRSGQLGYAIGTAFGLAFKNVGEGY